MKKYNDNVLSPKEYQKKKRDHKISLAMRRKKKGKISNKRIEELK
ncbi:hypothetical protein LCGC14_0462130 [marine sediment metagenome]|uniref:Uncharacterized protein n=1 Tax=marine sediment metagenome TaxID=412755 RepID=A0A0F9SJY6_9ZZZZ